MSNQRSLKRSIKKAKALRSGATLCDSQGMPTGTTTMIGVDFKELATMLVRELDIHEGHWGVCMAFSHKAMNVNMNTEDNMVPAVLTMIPTIGLQKFEGPCGLSVDAAEVNPRPTHLEVVQ